MLDARPELYLRSEGGNIYAVADADDIVIVPGPHVDEVVMTYDQANELRNWLDYVLEDTHPRK